MAVSDGHPRGIGLGRAPERKFDPSALPKPEFADGRNAAGWDNLLAGLTGWVAGIFSLPVDDPELACSQYAALLRQIPMLYAVLLTNAVALAATHAAIAPLSLTLAVPVVLCGACVVRLVTWVRARGRAVTAEEAIRQMRKTVLLTGVTASGFTIWSFCLFPYGDAYDQCHVAFYMAMTLISSIFCLMHLRAAALLLAAIVVVPLTIFLLATGRVVFMAMAGNLLFVSVALIMVMLRNYGDFAALISSRRELIMRQNETQRLSDENLRLANLDSLSSLPNRRSFFEELERTIAWAERDGARFAVAVLDLDRFKGINDVYGHAAGDRLLTQVGLRLKRIASDTLFIARLGGDEFGAILFDGTTDRGIELFGANLKTLFAGPCVVGDKLTTISCSVGVALYPKAGRTAEMLFERADYALYFGKQIKKGEMVVFSDEHETTIRQSSRLEQALRGADFEAEMWMAFQPIVDMARRRVIAFEALARWQSPELGAVKPDQFIKVAERTQMIGPLTEVLLNKALVAAADWPPSVRVCFNLSANDLIDKDTMAAVRRTVMASDVTPSRIEFEVTETALLQDFELATASIDGLRALGARVALDDFGAGFASLGYVHRLTLDKIKIDQSFIADVDVSRTSPNIIRSIVDLCRNLDLECVVEGVETESQLRALMALGCQYMQGYLLSRPVPAEQVMRVIDRISPIVKAQAPPRVAAQ
jgi:diguanylate cyclase (GGDEF)-like protein